VIRVHFLPFSFTCKAYDALVLTSKNAVIALEKTGIAWHSLPCYAIGEGTKAAIERAGGSVVHVASQAYGDVFAAEISSHLCGKHVLFPRAKIVVSDVAGALRQAGVVVEEKIAYETTCVPCEEIATPEENSVFIFTSPSSVRCFFACLKWNATWHAVCIGDKTASTLPTTISAHLPTTQTVEACVELAAQLYVGLSKNSL
jgi:uroporphyrinogen-III synthase